MASPSRAAFERFSDGAFSIILAHALASIYVGVIWLSHHYMFERLCKVNTKLNWINLGIIGMSSFNSVSNGRAGRCVSRWGCHRSKGGDRAIRPDRESHVRGLVVRVHFPTEALIPEGERWRAAPLSAPSI
jgi:hypothetical protein